MNSSPIPPIPQASAYNTATFRFPPLDGSLTLTELFDWHSDNSPEHPFYVYANEDGTKSTIKFPELAKAIYKGCGPTKGSITVIQDSLTFSSPRTTLSCLYAVKTLSICIVRADEGASDGYTSPYPLELLLHGPCIHMYTRVSSTLASLVPKK